MRLILKTIARLQYVWTRFLIKNSLRELKKTACSYTEPIKVNGISKVNKNTYLGKNISFNGMIISGKAKVTIGDNFHSGSGCQIIPSYHNFDSGERIPYDSTYIHKDVLIKDNVWLGNNVIILGGVTLGEGVIIQAGSVVVKSIPDYSIAGGHPAEVFSSRDIDHYEKLKSSNMFH